MVEEMNHQKVVLRADAGKNIGYGHFIRSLALAGYLKDDFDCTFCTFNSTEHHPTQYQLDEINKICRYRHIEADSLEAYNQLFINSLSGNEIVVLDNYYFRTDYQRQIREKGCRLVCVDDIHDRHMVADAVITCCPIDVTSFSLEPYTKFCGGLRYSFLREEFLTTNDIAVRKECISKKIVIAIGGADPFRLTDKIIDIIQNIDVNLEIAVIAGDAVEISNGNHKNVNVYHKLSAKEIVELFKWADLGIFPASTICIEALACRLPVAVGWYVDNQEELYSYGVAKKLFVPLGNFLTETNKLKDSLVKVLKSKTRQCPIIDFTSGKREIIQLFKEL